MKPFTHKLHIQTVPSWKMMFGGLPETYDGLITVYTGHTMKKEAINTIPNVLLEKVNVLAASQTLNMQQKLN